MPTTGCRVLLVEDHDDTLRIMSRLLARLGFDVLTAGGVNEALDVAGREKFDVLVSDLGLPDGTGLELMKSLKARGPVKGIALSGFAQEEDIRKSREVGFDEHLVKPISIAQLQQVLSKLSGVASAAI